MYCLDLFSCIGCHALGFHRAGIETAAFCEIDPWRQSVLSRNFPLVPINGDIHAFVRPPKVPIVFGGPPCKRTSVSAAPIKRRDGDSLWPEMLRVGLTTGAEWIVVEQPPGNKAWERGVQTDLAAAGYHVARIEFSAHDLGAPYQRRRVYTMGCTSLPRLEVAWKSIPEQIDHVKRTAASRDDWRADKLATLPLVARTAGDLDGGYRSAERRRRIEALGDSNPPQMAEVIGRAIMRGHQTCSLSM